MDDSKDLIIVEQDGGVLFSRPEAKKRLGAKAGSYRLVDGPAGLLVLRESGRSREEPGARVLMAGEIVSRATVLEIINMLAQSAWNGELMVYGADDTRRSLLLDQGALSSATSNVKNELLGEILLSRRVITKKQLAECLRQIGGQRRFGEIVVDNGYIARERLFENLHLQIETIFGGALMVSEGRYLFARLPENAEPPAVKAHLPISKLLMEAVQRIDEMELYRGYVPSGSMRPVARSNAPKAPLDKALNTVAALADGERSLTEIATELGWDEFKTTKAVYQLIQHGCMELRVPPGDEAETVRRLVSEFNGIMRGIFAVVSKHGGKEQMPWTLNAWMKGSGLDQYVGDKLGDRCTVDAKQVTAALRKLDCEHPLPVLLKALHDLASFAMFSAAPFLNRKVEQKLARIVDKRVKNLRL